MKPTSSAVFMLVLVTLAACSSERTPSPDEGGLSPTATESPSRWVDFEGVKVTPSIGCEEAAVVASAEKNPSAAEPLIAATLDACANADEWLSVVQIHPGVMGLTSAAKIGRLELQSACFEYQESAVCADAASRGLKF